MMECGGASSLLQCVIRNRDRRRTAGAKGISGRVGEFILDRESNAGDVAIVEALLNTYCPSATLSVSEL